MTVVPTTTLPPKTPMCDYSFARPIPGGLLGAGIRGVIRYLSYSTNGKNITPDEVAKLHAAELGILLVWENIKSDPLSGGPLGNQHGNAAVYEAVALGYPKGLPIFVAVDYDTLKGSDTMLTTAYVAEFSKVVRAAGFKCGWYGGSRLWLYSKDSIDIKCRAAAGAWSPIGLYATSIFNPEIRQGNTAVVGGGSVDWDWTTTSVDVWLPRTIPDPTPPAQIPATVKLGSTGLVVALCQQHLRGAGLNVKVDGIFGPQTSSAVKVFQKAHRLVVDGVVGPQTWGVLLTFPIG